MLVGDPECVADWKVTVRPGRSDARFIDLGHGGRCSAKGRREGRSQPRFPASPLWAPCLDLCGTVRGCPTSSRLGVPSEDWLRQAVRCHRAAEQPRAVAAFPGEPPPRLRRGRAWWPQRKGRGLRGVEGADERSRVIIAPTPKRAPGRGFRGTLSSRPCARGNGCQANDRDDGDCSSRGRIRQPGVRGDVNACR